MKRKYQVRIGLGPIIALALFLVCAALFSSPGHATDNGIQPFNVTNDSAAGNGNGWVGMSRIKAMAPGTVWRTAKEITDAGEIDANTYSYLGKLVKLPGLVATIQQVPPPKGIGGIWHIISLVTKDSNTPLGSIPVGVFYNEDVSWIHSGSTITCAGYFVGTGRVGDTLGGTLRSLIMVGNACHRLIIDPPPK